MADTLPDAPVFAERPQLTLPEAEAALVHEEYARAGVILEYGSGGSTVLAGSMPGKQVFSVESDLRWAQRMKRWFRDNPPASRVVVHHADVGPTVGWGKPADEIAFRKWPSYPNSVWDRRDFAHPDVVLIDGRFRAACLLTVALRILRPVTVLFDDYRDRKPYHVVEQLLPPSGLVGRMARFEVAPLTLPPKRLQWLIGLYLKPL